MRLLELFSGTGSVGDVFRQHGWSVVSLDRDMPADIRMDIMEWDFREFETHAFDFVWCSPPCTEYSIAKTVGARRIDEANAIVRRALEIVRYFDPPYWALENPQSGLLKRQDFMIAPYHDLDYCCYGMPYRKRTRLWGELGGWVPKPLCRWDCPYAEGGRHRTTAQQRSSDGTRHKASDLYRVPRELIEEILGAI
jgi:site-specific DNA-cytosine methylase